MFEESIQKFLKCNIKEYLPVKEFCEEDEWFV